MSRRAVRKVLFLIMIFAAVATAGYAVQFLGGVTVPSAHGFPGQTGTNIVGINCALGTIDPVGGTSQTGRDGNWTLAGISDVQKSCQWFGGTNAAGQSQEQNAEPLVTDPAPANPAATCPTTPGVVGPCGAPGGGGFEADIILTNLNSAAADHASVNGFDLTLSYNPAILRAVQIDQVGLLFGGNVGCSSCTLTLASTIDNNLGQVRVAQTLLAVQTGSASGTVPLFRVRFDIVGAGTSSLTIGGSDSVTYNNNGVASPLPHTDVAGSFSTDVFFDTLVNGLTYPATLGFSAGFTFNPTSPIAGKMITFTATAACTGCTGALSYHWAFASAEGFPGPTFTMTGQSVTVNDTTTVVNRVTLAVLDSATTPHNVTATQGLPLAASVFPSPLVIAGTGSTHTGSITARFFGGVPNYSGSWLFCPAGSLTAKVCSASKVIIAATANQIDTRSISYNYAGLYTGTLTIGDSSPAWVGGAVSVIQSFQVNVTGTPQAFTVTLTPNATSVTAPHQVTVTAAVAYASTYPAGNKAALFSYTYAWGDGTSSTFTGQPLTYKGNHTYTKTGTFVVEVTAQEDSPSAAPTLIQENGFSAPITVSSGVAPPTVAISCPPTGTAGTSLTCTATGSGGTPPYTFAWSATGGSPATGTGTSFTTTFGTKGSDTIGVTLTDNAAKTATNSATVTIAPVALGVSISGPTTGTAGTAVTFTATGSGGTTPYTFSWSAPGGTPATGTGASFAVTYSVKGTYTVNATGTDNNGAKGFKLATITINPATPVSDSISGPTTGTTGTAVTFTATATGGTSPYQFSWSAPGGTPATGTGASLTVTYSVKGTYTVNATVTDNNGAHASKTATITISPATLVSDTVSGPTTGTVGTAVAFTASATGGTSPYTFSWSAPGGNPATGTGASFAVTYNVKGTYTVNATVTDNNGAKAFKLATITINPLPLSDSVSGPTTGTVGTAVTFSATATGGTSPYTFSWSAVGGTPATGTGASFTVTYSVKGTFTVNATVTDNNSKHASKTAAISISGTPPAVTISGPTTGTAGTAVTFTASATGGTSPYTFSWSAPGGTPATGTGASFTVTYNVKGTYTVNATVTDNNGAHASKTASITISPVALADSVAGPTTGTVGTAVTFTASATGGTSPYTFSWSAPGGTPATGTGASFTVTYNVKGTYTVNATVTDNNGKHASKTASITISPQTLADSISGPTTGTPGTAVTFTASATGGTSPYTFSWSAPGGNPATGSGASLTVTFAAKGTFTVNATVTDNNGAHASKTAQIAISSTPLSDSISGPTTGTVGTAVTFTATATGGTSPYIFSWSAPGGTPATGTGASFTVTYNVKGSYTVNATVTDNNGAHASKTASISIPSTPVVVTLSGQTTGTVGTAVTFTSSAIGGTSPYTFSWSALGGTPATGTGASFTVTYNIKGTYTVNATATDNNGAKASKTASITISPLPFSVSVSGPTSGTAGTAVTFTATGTGGTSPYTFSWSALGGTPATGTGASFTVTYNVQGTYSINATGTDNNSKHASKVVQIVISPPSLAVSVSGPSSGTVGIAVTFTATASGGTAPFTFSWSAPGGTPATGTGGSFTVTYNVKGSYTVNATVTDNNGAHASKTASISISSTPPVVSISGPTTGTAGTAVTFIASATGGTSPYTFSWSAPGGTPSTGTGASFTVTYNIKGTYTVNATVTDNNGAKAFKLATVAISPLALGVSISVPTSGTVGTVVTFTASATGGTAPYSFSWSAPGGTPATGTGASFTVTYSVKGTYTVNATVTDNNGAHASKIASITISPVALAVTVTGPSTATTGQSVTFTASPSGGTGPYMFAWSVNSAPNATATSSSFSTTFNSTGTDTISVAVTDANGKTATNSMTLTVSSVSGAHPTQTTNTCTPGSVVVNTTTTCSAKVTDTSPTAPTNPTGTVTFGSNDTGTFSPAIMCTLSSGPGSTSSTCSVTYTPRHIGQHVITGTYSGDSTHSASTGSFTLNVRPVPKGKPVLLTFTGFALDDFDNGIGQLDVLVNGQLVVDIPAGLNHLNGTGDFNAYEGAFVNFGPFDITGLLVTGQNTILFKDPTTFDHFGIVGNVLIKQDGNTILSALRFRGVYPEFSFKYTFQFPALTVVSFAALANNVSVNSATTNQPLTFTATYSGGTGAAICVFSFGNDRRVAVKGLNGTCSTVVDFDTAGTFVARVVIAGAKSSDLQKNSVMITVA